MSAPTPSPSALCTCGHPFSDHKLYNPSGLGLEWTCRGNVLALSVTDDAYASRETWCHCDFFSEATDGQVREWEERGG